LTQHYRVNVILMSLEVTITYNLEIKDTTMFCLITKMHCKFCKQHQ